MYHDSSIGKGPIMAKTSRAATRPAAYGYFGTSSATCAKPTPPPCPKPPETVDLFFRYMGFVDSAPTTPDEVHALMTEFAVRLPFKFDTQYHGDGEPDNRYFVVAQPVSRGEVYDIRVNGAVKEFERSSMSLLNEGVLEDFYVYVSRERFSGAVKVTGKTRGE